MAEKEKADGKNSFSDISKQEALRRLYESVNEKPCSSAVLRDDAIAAAQAVMLEGVDFDLTYTPLMHLGRKAVLACIGKLYAQMCNPHGISVVLGLSAKLTFDNVTELWKGIAAAAHEHNVDELHLDLKPSLTGLMISVTAVGEKVVDLVPFSNMDLVCLSGNVGGAFFGQQVLQREKDVFAKAGNAAPQPDLSKYRFVVGAYLSPTMYTDVAERFKEFNVTPSGGVFLSIPLANGVKELQHESGFGIKIYTEKIPLDSGTVEASEEFGVDGMTAALHGGDDYRFLFTIPISQADAFRKDFQDYDIIGHLAQPEVGAVVVTSDGAELTLKAQGYDDPNPEEEE
jgi:thiamine-monophosphate kinase